MNTTRLQAKINGIIVEFQAEKLAAAHDILAGKEEDLEMKRMEKRQGLTLEGLRQQGKDFFTTAEHRVGVVSKAAEAIKAKGFFF